MKSTVEPQPANGSRCQIRTTAVLNESQLAPTAAEAIAIGVSLPLRRHQSSSLRSCREYAGTPCPPANDHEERNELMELPIVIGHSENERGQT